MVEFATGNAAYLEGKDDEHVIGQLLLRQGVDSQSIPELVDAKGKSGVLRAITVSIRAGTGRSLAFVLDANADLKATWNGVRSRLQSVGVEAPRKIPTGGFIGESSEFGTRVGVWLMPDNRRTGALEDFLEDLIDGEDQLLPHAEDSTSTAQELGALFPLVSAKKAVLHTWLAWQEEPGRPYGLAIKAHYLRDDSDAARRFVLWFRSLFEIA